MDQSNNIFVTCNQAIKITQGDEHKFASNSSLPSVHCLFNLRDLTFLTSEEPNYLALNKTFNE